MVLLISKPWASQPPALVAAAAAYRARAALYRLRRFAPELGLAAATFDDGCDGNTDDDDSGSKQGGDDEKEKDSEEKDKANKKKGGDWDRPLRELFGGAQASLYVCFCLFVCVSWDLYLIILDD